MKNTLFLFILILLFSTCSNEKSEDFKVADLRCNNLENPSGTGDKPDLSWIDKSIARGTSQSAYEIILASTKKDLRSEKKCLWNSGKVNSSSTLIRYTGPALETGSHYYWKVRVWDQTGNSSKWSEPASFITGLFDKTDWNEAKWIGYEEIPDSLLLVPGVHGNGNNLGEVAKKRTVVPYFRKEFSFQEKRSPGLLFLSAAWDSTNCTSTEKSGDRFLSPGWTDSRKTCYYNTYDVTE